MFDRGAISQLAEAIVPGITMYMLLINLGLVLFLRTKK